LSEKEQDSNVIVIRLNKKSILINVGYYFIVFVLINVIVEILKKKTFLAFILSHKN